MTKKSKEIIIISLWFIYGSLFYSHLEHFTKNATWWHWWNRLKRNFSYKQEKWKRIIWWIMEPYWPGMKCPHCGYDFDWYEDPWFECSDDGSYAIPGEYTTHWWKGIQTCPRCRYKWEVYESSG